MRRLKILWTFVSFFLFGLVALAQNPAPTPPEEKPKLVERIDIAKAKSVNADPHLQHGPDGTVHAVCEITVTHEDGSVYKQFPYDALVDKENDAEVIIGIANSYNACRDRLVEILTAYRDYHHMLQKNTVSAKKAR